MTLTPGPTGRRTNHCAWAPAGPLATDTGKGRWQTKLKQRACRPVTSHWHARPAVRAPELPVRHRAGPKASTCKTRTRLLRSRCPD